MNESLYKSLKKETTKELWYNFKHDGLMNFEKKIVSGNILYQRKYSVHLLRSEKAIIVNSIINQIRDYNNVDKTIKKNRSKVKSRIITGSIGFLFVLSMLIIDYFFKEKMINYSSIVGISLGLAFLFYSIYTFEKKIKQGIKADMEDLKILKEKLRIIEHEWNF